MIFGGLFGGKKGKSSSKAIMYPGQKEFGADAFAQLFRPLLGGAPITAFESSRNRGTEQLGEEFARRGLTGSGIEAGALADFQNQAQVSEEAARIDAVLAALGLAPIGQKNKSSSFEWGVSGGMKLF